MKDLGRVLLLLIGVVMIAGGGSCLAFDVWGLASTLGDPSPSVLFGVLAVVALAVALGGVALIRWVRRKEVDAEPAE